MECKSCGASIDRRSAFCSKCGEVTSFGQPLGQKLRDAFVEIGQGLGKFANIAFGYLSDPANRKKVIGGGVVFILLLTILTDNPFSYRLKGLFEVEEPELEYTSEGLPDFSNYADIFLSEEKEFYVKGKANVRDYPTSQGTLVMRTLPGGETVRAREVKAFDPASLWFKLSDGGYGWGGNLLSVDQIENQAGVMFPMSLQGRWSDRNSCSGTGEDFEISISATEVDFGSTLFGLVNILSAGEEIPVYQMDGIGPDTLPDSNITLAEDARWPILWITNGVSAQGDRFAFYRNQLSCSDVKKIQQRLM